MPNTIILTSEEKDQEKLLQVKEVLDSIPGKFFSFELKRGSKGPFITLDSDRLYDSKEDFFVSMNEFRKQDLGSSEYLVFLTSRKIPGGYFNGIEFERRNIFVDLENWERVYLQGSPDRYPIAFHVLISVLINHYFPDEPKAQQALHMVDKGCILDFNGYKNNVDLKILTARICPDCLDTLLQYNPDPNLLAFFRHGIERIRQDIVNGEYYEKIKPKPVSVLLKRAYSKKLGYKLEFEGIGSLDLDAAHLIVYLNFLRKKEGMHLHHIWRDYHFLFELYDRLSSSSGESKVRSSEKTISKLCKLKIENGDFKEIKSNALNERISFINTQLTKLLGTFGLQEFYQILKRDNGKYGLSPEVEFDDDEVKLVKSIEQFVKNKPVILLK